MTWSLLDSGSVGFADGNAGHAFSFPGGAANAGDLLLLGVDSDTIVSTPSGWTDDKDDVANIGAYFFRKVATGGETSVTITTSGDFPTSVGFLRYLGATATPFDVSVAAHHLSGASTTPAATTATLAGTGELSVAIACLGNLGGATPTSPVWSTGYTNRIDQNTAGTGSSDQHLFMADNRNAGTAAESPGVSWTNATGNQTLIVATYKPSAGSTLSADAAQAITHTDAAAATLALGASATQAATATQAAVSTVDRQASATQAIAHADTADATVTRVAGATQVLVATQAATATLILGAAVAQAVTATQHAAAATGATNTPGHLASRTRPTATLVAGTPHPVLRATASGG